MSWHQLILDVPDDLIDAVVGEVSGGGVAGVWESHAPEPGVTRLVIYFNIRSNLDIVEDSVRTIFQRAERSNPPISRGIVEDLDWTGEWKKSYTSFPIGDDFFVMPSWEDCTCPDDRLPIRIDSGQAFGTGTHETTQLTMEALGRWVEPDQTVLDLGTGSGILAISARLLGAKDVFACDIDPVAVQVARANVERNAEQDIFVFCGSLDAVKTDSIRLLLANLTADLITGLVQEFRRVLTRHGIAILSGILREQSEELRKLITSNGFSIFEEITQGEWLVLIVDKHVA